MIDRRPNDTISSAGRRFPAWLRIALLVFVGWTLYGLVVANLFTAFQSPRGAEPVLPLSHRLRFWLPQVWLWALLTFPVIAAARRFRITRRSLPLHFVFALVIHVTHRATIYFLHPWVRPGPRPEWPGSLISTTYFDLFVYAAIAATAHAIEAQGQTLKLRNALLESELRLLRMQLQPHFLFNTLNAISELIHRDARRAEQALARLGDLLRWSLQSADQREVPLREELVALQHYLEIQRLRHGEGLRFRIEVDRDTLGLAVPGLLLQPLVENALRHGLRGASTGQVTIRARRDGERLILGVLDDGHGLAMPLREGTGLSATRARLEGLYGGDHAFRLGPGPAGGAEVDITLPARVAERGDASEVA